MAKTVKITTDNKISIVEIPWSYKSQKKEIGAECTEIVKTQIMYNLFCETIVMIVDESGAVKDREINTVASMLYGIMNHGCPIHGDIIFGFQNGPDVLPIEDPEKLMATLIKEFPILSK